MPPIVSLQIFNNGLFGKHNKQGGPKVRPEKYTVYYSLNSVKL